MKRSSLYLLVVFALVFLLFLLPPSKAAAAPLAQQGDRWCGKGSEPNYSFDTHGYPLAQPYWVVSNGLVSEQTQIALEPMLDLHKAEELSETIILLLPVDQIGDGPTCAAHFGRYMKLGLVSGPHKDRGMVWLFIVNSDGSLAEVRYGVGLGLPALTAPKLGDLKRVGMDTYTTTKSVDEAVIAVVTGYDQYVRSVYGVAAETSPTQQTTPNDQNDTEPSPGVILALIMVVVAVFVGIGFLVVGGSQTRTETVVFEEPEVDEEDEAEPKKRRSASKSKKTKKAPKSKKTKPASRRKSRREEESPSRSSRDDDDDSSSYRPSYNQPSFDPPSMPSMPTFNPPNTGSGSGGIGRSG